ncbi:DNA polymerase-like [Mangifera indica]|uniref:DNA polymerase-like n=1 Tax=Mangifera indica TaxID=29780 RepID=UPI001CFAEDCC|nr:DNA polymerase-like [Mangifera indica]
MKGYFLAPKSYFYISIDSTNVLKYKGPAKNQVYPEWFELQYADPSRTELVPVEANFRIDWHTLNIIKKDTFVRLGIKHGAKRIPVYHRDVWVDTDPIDIIDLSSLDHIGKQIIKSLRNDVQQLQTENQILNEKLSQKEREIAERYKEMKSQFDAKKNTD